MTFMDFHRLYMDASECDTAELFMAECGGSADFASPEDAVRTLTVIHAIVHGGGDFRAIANACGLSIRALALRLNIPLRSAENWTAPADAVNRRSATPWALQLIAYAAVSSMEADDA